jgi:hypothetical protein
MNWQRPSSFFTQSPMNQVVHNNVIHEAIYWTIWFIQGCGKHTQIPALLLCISSWLLQVPSWNSNPCTENTLKLW